MQDEKLVSAEVFEEDDKHYMRLVYEYNDEENTPYRRIYPKVEFPFYESMCPIIVKTYTAKYKPSVVIETKPLVYAYPKCDIEVIERGVDAPSPMFDIDLNWLPEENNS